MELEQIRKAVKMVDGSVSAKSAEIGITQSSLQRFLSGKRGLSGEAMLKVIVWLRWITFED